MSDLYLLSVIEACPLLEHLCLESSGLLTSASLSALVRLHKTLRSLTLLSGDEIPPAAIAAWHGQSLSTNRPRLRSQTGGNSFTHASSVESSTSESLQALPRLSLESLRLGFRVNTDEQLTQKHVQSVEDLLLVPSHSKFGRTLHWVETCKMPTLQRLDLQKCKLSDAAIKGLLFSECYTQLQTINISGAIWPKASRLVLDNAEPEPARPLEVLRCDKCNFFEEDLLWLIARCPALRCLSMRGIPMDMECLDCVLSACPSLTTLKYAFL